MSFLSKFFSSGEQAQSTPAVRRATIPDISPVTATQIAEAGERLKGSPLETAGFQALPRETSRTFAFVNRGNAYDTVSEEQIRVADAIFKGSALEAHIGSKGSPFQADPARRPTLGTSYGAVSPVTPAQMKKADELLSSSSSKVLELAPKSRNGFNWN